MRALPFFLCIFMTAFLVALYTSRHNHLTELRIQARALEKQVKVEEAVRKQLELTLAQFLNPTRLEEVAKKVQYARFHSPSEKEVVIIEE